ncbi:uncharacterized protein BDZ99DRAFT_470814 [Mytilinidion resinicola]|uniref:Uncharacterized protein n=1 Tax=Mytilinidion resinicola TaxID=574789 RepID=A0A6A6ZAZ2_9PEZI|nr:uncharacterized protein BDZ99DRAFT_470814 [Mytilinidion resinicola]KAF2817869.1 hypothetical protein BDZ99DRAFT_470814 [Mytilinidion resinicola]
MKHIKSQAAGGKTEKETGLRASMRRLWARAVEAWHVAVDRVKNPGGIEEFSHSRSASAMGLRVERSTVTTIQRGNTLAPSKPLQKITVAGGWRSRVVRKGKEGEEDWA